MTTRLLFFTVILAVVATARIAVADDKAACLDAADQGQKLRSAHKLLDARDKFRLCAAAGCPAVVQSDCAGWLTSVDGVLPSVVVTAKDGAGASVVDVTVTVDGKPFATRLGGEAVSLDPGPHAFHFEGRDGTTLDQVVVAAEGEQNQRVAVVLDGKSHVPPATAGTEGGVASRPARATAASGGPPFWKTFGWVASGVGLAGIGVGAVFGALAISDHNAAECTSSNVCLTGHLNDARSAATVSNVAFVAGGVLFATGAGLILFAPGSNAGGSSARASSIAPVLSLGPRGFVVGGTFR